MSGEASSSAWAPLLPAALVGTERHAAPLPPWPGEVGAAIAAVIAGADPASAVLRAAAVLAACSAAGAQGALLAAPLPAAAPADTQEALTDPGPLLPLAWALREGTPRLQQAVAAALARAGLRLPPALLPAVLELGRRSLGLRAAFAPALGERGRWLAQQREDWRYAVGAAAEADVQTVWQDGSFEQRRALLQRERAADPAAARERLQAALPGLPARERAEFVAALAEGLSPDDEALLDSLRSDRSRDVRQAALALLLRLPEAAHPRRAAARLAAFVTSSRGLLGRRWDVDAPAAAAADWKDDQIDAARPTHDRLGERGWWLYQLVRQVPLAWWRTHTGMDEAELLKWSAKTDWAEALQRGWREVLLAAPDSAWCEAVLDAGPAVWPEHQAQLLSLLPPARRERHWQRQLKDGSVRLDGLLAQVLAACPAPQTLPATLSAALVQQLLARDAAATLANDFGLRAQLPELAAALHLQALAALAALQRRPDDTPSWADTQHTLAQTLATRRALNTLAPETTP